jgi:elongation factor G
MVEPRHLIEVAIEPKTKADQEKLRLALARLAQEDPSFGVTVDHESGQVVIKGMNERQLENNVDRLKREFTIEANVGAPQVAYRETITRIAEIDYTHKKQAGGSGQFARVKLRLEPIKPGEGYAFESEAVGDAVPEAYITGVVKGLEGARETGVLAGFPVIDFKAVLVDGAYHDGDSSALAFEIATRAVFRAGIAKAGPILLEPIMTVEVITPDDVMGQVVAGLLKRRGEISAMETRGSTRAITATVPLAGLFGYDASLAALTGGRASWSMQFARYAPMADRDPDPKFPAAAAARVA